MYDLRECVVVWDGAVAMYMVECTESMDLILIVNGFSGRIWAKSVLEKKGEWIV